MFLCKWIFGNEQIRVLNNNWDAAEYQQENPLSTDENGKYAWDVPEGMWQVKFEKEGYETTYSEWLPVPPPQTEVNVEMISTEEAKVEKVIFTNNTAHIVFSKYMDIESITKEQIDILQDGKILTTTLKAVDEVEYKDKKVAKEVCVTLANGSFESDTSYTVQVKAGVKTYAGVATMKDSVVEKTYQPLPTTLAMEEIVGISYYEAGSYVLSGKLDNPDERVDMKNVELEVSSSDENITVDQANIKIAEDGSVQIPLQVGLPVSTEITLHVKDTNIVKTISVQTSIVEDKSQANMTEGQEQTGTTEDKNETTEKAEEQKTAAKVNGFAKQKVTKNTVNLVWNKAENIDGYILYGCESSKKTKVKIATLNAKQTSYTVKKLNGKKLTSATSYLFYLVAYKENEGETLLGEQVKASATTLFETAVLKGVKKKGAKVMITWKKTAGASGYEIYVSQKKASGYTKKATIKKGKTQKITLGKWKKGKQYYVKVRAYKTVKGKKVYGAFSKIKSVKIK